MAVDWGYFGDTTWATGASASPIASTLGNGDFNKACGIGTVKGGVLKETKKSSLAHYLKQAKLRK